MPSAGRSDRRVLAGGFDQRSSMSFQLANVNVGLICSVQEGETLAISGRTEATDVGAGPIRDFLKLPCRWRIPNVRAFRGFRALVGIV